ncbi:hybrid sensor histidine kinase/response regulator [Desulfobacula phenolica]|uniref:histidine kinase n=1 Tax=Desulfobacula phenolica TaxID=90732 RepID=A0A1H2J9F0_9BACT|nr:sensor histidine kinase [Desulfobacula phenolica]SDU52999.1 Signal transduction histidine kinase [Desulfobacula phenolica]
MKNSGLNFKQKNYSTFSEKIARVANLFHLLGVDCKKNIDIILEQTCHILDGACSLYCRMDDNQKSLKLWAGYKIPKGFDEIFDVQDSFFRKTTIKDKNTPVIFSDLKNTPFFATDPIISKYNLKSCLGFPVTLKNKIIGLLCILDIKTRFFTTQEVHCIQTLAASLKLEEERLYIENERLDLQQKACEEKEKYLLFLEKKLKRSEKIKLISTVAGGVAHDLNNILSGLVSYPELLLIKLPPDSPFKEYISLIHDAGLKAADIVHDLLTLTRRGIPNQIIINLNKVICEYVKGSAHKRLEKNHPQIEFKINSAEDLLNISGSPSHILKVIMNLVINAAEAIKGKGTVTIETFNRYIDMNSNKYDTLLEGDYVVLRIMDDGDGIPKKDLNRIFEPFYTKKQMGRSGSGLGLFVVWNCVKDHMGYIEVNSKKNEFTVFELYFPATRKKADSDPNDFFIDNFKGSGQTVLVVDDSYEQRKITLDLLEMLGYTPSAVSSGKAAVAVLEKHPFDLILLDMEMAPGIDGLETYKRILKINPIQKAIIATGLSKNEKIKKTLMLGAGHYIKKPYTIEKLACTLKNELNS